MEHLTYLGELAGSITGILALLCLIVRPIREKLLGLGVLAAGMRCVLRSEMLHTYYKHHEDNKIRQHEYENFVFSYKAYKALGGNSFIDKIYKDVQTWEVYT